MHYMQWSLWKTTAKIKALTVDKTGRAYTMKGINAGSIKSLYRNTSKASDIVPMIRMKARQFEAVTLRFLFAISSPTPAAKWFGFPLTLTMQTVPPPGIA